MKYFLAGLLIAVSAAAGADVLTTRRFVAEIAALKADNAALAARVGASCEPVYGAWWEERSCPGLFGGAVPEALRPLVCPGRIRVYRSDDFEAVRAKVQAAGPGAAVLVLKEHGVREESLPADWTVQIKEGR